MADKCQHVSCIEGAFESVYVPVGRMWRARDFCLEHATQAMRNRAVTELPEGAILWPETPIRDLPPIQPVMPQQEAILPVSQAAPIHAPIPVITPSPPPDVEQVIAQEGSPPLAPVMPVVEEEPPSPMKNDGKLECQPLCLPSPTIAETDAVSVETAPVEGASVEAHVIEVHAPVTETQQVEIVTTMTDSTMTQTAEAIPMTPEETMTVSDAPIDPASPFAHLQLKETRTPEECALVDCDRGHKARGVCGMHYAALYAIAKKHKCAMPDWGVPRERGAAAERRARGLMMQFPDMSLNSIALACNLPLARVQSMKAQSQNRLGKTMPQMVVSKSRFIRKSPPVIDAAHEPVAPPEPPKPTKTEPAPLATPASKYRRLSQEQLNAIVLASDADDHPYRCRINVCPADSEVRGLCKHHYDTVRGCDTAHGTALMDKVALSVHDMEAKRAARRQERENARKLKVVLETILMDTELEVNDAIASNDPVEWGLYAHSDIMARAQREAHARHETQLLLISTALGVESLRNADPVRVILERIASNRQSPGSVEQDRADVLRELVAKRDTQIRSICEALGDVYGGDTDRAVATLLMHIEQQKDAMKHGQQAVETTAQETLIPIIEPVDTQGEAPMPAKATVIEVHEYLLAPSVVVLRWPEETDLPRVGNKIIV